MDFTSLSTACIPSTFLPTLQIFGAQILATEALLVTNFSASVSGDFRFTQPSISYQNATFCNVTVTYTHPGQGDQVHAETWLPIGNWNNRLLAVGGAAWAAGRAAISYETMKGALGDGFATITNDAGVSGEAHVELDWALLSPGNVNLHKLQNFGSRSVNEQSIIGKSLVRSFYGRGPSFSYWSGCSTGGRQGLVAAQRYPTAYDGIAIGAPALYMPTLLASVQWPQQVMNTLNHYPHPCEFDALTTAAISACDALDGLRDGIVSDPAACLATFNPFSLVGTPLNCSSRIPNTNTSLSFPLSLSRAAATTANQTWHGPSTPSGRRIHPGLSPAADLTGNDPRSGGIAGLAATNCTCAPPVPDKPDRCMLTCAGTADPISTPWFALFLAKSALFNTTALTHLEFARLVHAGVQEYASLLSSDDADLSEFHAAGGEACEFPRGRRPGDLAGGHGSVLHRGEGGDGGGRGGCAGVLEAL